MDISKCAYNILRSHSSLYFVFFLIENILFHTICSDYGFSPSYPQMLYTSPITQIYTLSFSLLQNTNMNIKNTK